MFKLIVLVAVSIYLAIGSQGLPAGWEVFGAVLALLSPVALKYAPASWKGKPMVAIAVVLSLALGVLAMFLQGDFAHFDYVRIGEYLGSLIALQQLFYALFKDNWNLSDPSAVPVAQVPGQPAAQAPITPAAPPPSPPATK